jgi:hypothetical protein
MKLFILTTLLFFLPNILSAQTTNPAKINPATFTLEKAAYAVYSCGFNVLNAVHNIPICHNVPNDCWSTGYEPRGPSQVSAHGLVTEMAFVFAMDYEYRSLDGSYRVAVKSNINTGPLTMKFSDTLGKGSHGDLITSSPMPYLQFTQTEVKNCSYDNYGNQVCQPSQFNYDSFTWTLPAGYIPVSGWKNKETGVVLQYRADFAKYMTCVEQQLQ